MTTRVSLTQQWLRQNIQSYTQRDAVYADVDAALTRNPTIRPKTDVYTYDDGRSQLLLCLHGLLPITYRNVLYNIPIAIWITRDYPRRPPIPYVVPTADMLVRAGKHMDVSGRCTIEYILNWERKSEGCNVVALIDSMQEHFSRDPPVYARPPHGSSRSQTSYSEQTEQSPPPPPSVHSSPPLVNQSTNPHASPPPLPRKPGASAATPTLHTQTSYGQPSSRSQSPAIIPARDPALAMRPPPPLPPHPHTESGPPRYRSSPVPPMYAPYTRTTSIDSHPSWSPTPMSAGAEDSRWSSPPLHPPPSHLATASDARTSIAVLSPVGMHSEAARPPPPPNNGQIQAPPLPVPSALMSPQPTNVQQQSYYHAPLSAPSATHQSWAPPPARAPPPVPPPDFLDTDDLPTQSSNLDFAPPRPPNPELLRLQSAVHDKISSELASLSHAMMLDAERLRAHQADLLAGEPAIRDEMARLEAVRDVCCGVSGRLDAVVTAAERNVAELRRKGDPEVDELVCSTTIVHNQLINLVAEDNAIEDTIYHLHRALNTGRIDLERFLRTTRVLAEEQFTKRALIEKIQLGIPTGDMMSGGASQWP